tara:strand:+ start:72 stop:860 length:789 start_codon:yes stop_codon:yes gene_type:complete
MSDGLVLTKPKGGSPLPRTIVYGEPKIGKTTFGCSAPNAVLIGTEDGATGLDVVRITRKGERTIKSWGDVIHGITHLLKEEHDRKWVVIDTINGVVDLCSQHVCDRDFGGQWQAAKGKEGYNQWAQGDKACAQEFKRLINGLDMLREKRGMGCILLAHQGLHRSGNALGEDFMKFAADINKYSWSLLLGWADHIGHACRDFMVHTPQGREDKGKGVAVQKNETRWLVFDGGPGRDAGARAGYEMPGRIELSWSAYADAIAKK